jgi:hypothetical protein
MGGRQRRVDEKAERVVGRENNRLYYKKRGESEEDKIRDKKIMMVKLIIQKEPHQVQQQLSLLGKSSRVIPLVSNPGIGS